MVINLKDYYTFIFILKKFKMIKAESLQKRYGNQVALEIDDLVIESDKITGLIGPNGAGKSTFMKIICGYLSPTKGRVFINDEEVQQHNSELKKKIGYLPENNPLYYDLYVKEYLLYVAGIYKLQEKTLMIKKIIDQTGLGKEQNKKIGLLSKGYKQRVGLAQAIIHDPKILILDEPTSGLDPNQIIEIRNLIVELGKNKTVLLSTHILQEVEAICDKVVILNNGKIITNEETGKVQKQDKILLIEFDRNPLTDDIRKVEGVVSAENIKENIWAIKSEKNTDIRTNIFNFAVNNKLVILSQQYQESKLEDIFHKLTKNGK